MLVWIGIVIVLIAVWALMKQYETRTVLLGAGFLMAIIAGDPMAAFNTFSTVMTNKTFIQNILSVIGFSAVMTLTKCNLHLIHGSTNLLSHVRFLLVPGAAILTFMVNTALPSAAGTVAAVGFILIPVLISQGVNPCMAGAAVMMGTFGSLFSPGNAHNAFVSELTSKYLPDSPSTVMEVIAAHSHADIVNIIIGAASLFVVSLILKEDKGFVDTEGKYETVEKIKVNPLYAIIPLIPIVMLLLGALYPEQFPWLHKLAVPHCMLIGAFLGLVVTRTNPFECTKAFFKGAGESYGNIVAIIICAGVFTSGMQAIGLVDAGIELMKSSEHAASIASALGPFILAVVTGSGDAATLAFNQAITPHAADFGMTIVDMGNMANLAGALGRTMSPLTASCIIAAGFAKISPMEIAKRNAPGMIIALIVTYFVL